MEIGDVRSALDLFLEPDPSPDDSGDQEARRLQTALELHRALEAVATGGRRRRAAIERPSLRTPPCGRATSRRVAQRVADGLDPSLPMHLYAQIRELVRREIAVGTCRVGAPLPPIRLLASVTGVHFHTVRRAYLDLEAEGLVRLRRRVGTLVLERPRFPSPLHPALILTGHRSPQVAAQAPVFVLIGENADGPHLADQVGIQLGRAAVRWPWGAAGEPPPGTLVVSRRLMSRVQRTWPWRSHDLWCADIVGDEATLDDVRSALRQTGAERVRILATEWAGGARRAVELVSQGIVATEACRIEVRARSAGAGTSLAVHPGEILLVTPEHRPSEPPAVPQGSGVVLARRRVTCIRGDAPPMGS